MGNISTRRKGKEARTARESVSTPAAAPDSLSRRAPAARIVRHFIAAALCFSTEATWQLPLRSTRRVSKASLVYLKKTTTTTLNRGSSGDGKKGKHVVFFTTVKRVVEPPPPPPPLPPPRQGRLQPAAAHSIPFPHRPPCTTPLVFIPAARGDGVEADNRGAGIHRARGGVVTARRCVFFYVEYFSCLPRPLRCVVLSARFRGSAAFTPKAAGRCDSMQCQRLDRRVTGVRVSAAFGVNAAGRRASMQSKRMDALQARAAPPLLM